MSQPNSTPKIEAILFDLDGTLLDTAADLAAALNQLLQQEGKASLPFEAVRKIVSNGGNAMVSLGFSTTQQDPEHQRLYRNLLEIYGNNLATHTRPFPGIPALLQFIGEQGLPWGIVTNKPRSYSQPLIHHMRFTPACQTLVCPDDVAQRKPHPESMYLACEQLGCNPAQTLYIGDHQRDIEAGQNAGMRTIAALYGYIDDDTNPADWQADYYIQHPSEIIALLDTLT